MARKKLDHVKRGLPLQEQERQVEAESALPGIHPSPNIQEHPDIYELENLAADPEGKLEAACRPGAVPQVRSYLCYQLGYSAGSLPSDRGSVLAQVATFCSRNYHQATSL